MITYRRTTGTFVAAMITNQIFMAGDLSAKDKADYQKFIDVSAQTGTLSGKIDVARYLQAF
jgi:hypothetical protein